MRTALVLALGLMACGDKDGDGNGNGNGNAKTSFEGLYEITEALEVEGSCSASEQEPTTDTDIYFKLELNEDGHLQYFYCPSSDIFDCVEFPDERLTFQDDQGSEWWGDYTWYNYIPDAGEERCVHNFMALTLTETNNGVRIREEESAHQIQWQGQPSEEYCADELPDKGPGLECVRLKTYKAKKLSDL